MTGTTIMGRPARIVGPSRVAFGGPYHWVAGDRGELHLVSDAAIGAVADALAEAVARAREAGVIP